MQIVVAILTILKASGVFMPFNLEHLVSQYKEVFKQTKAKVILALEQYFKRYKSSSCIVIIVSNAIKRKEI